MNSVRAAVGYAGLIGEIVSAAMMLWHFWRIARLGRLDLVTNAFLFLDRSSHPPEIRPHVSGIWWWFAVAALCFVLFGVGSPAL